MVSSGFGISIANNLFCLLQHPFAARNGSSVSEETREAGQQVRNAYQKTRMPYGFVDCVKPVMVSQAKTQKSKKKKTHKVSIMNWFTLRSYMLVKIKQLCSLFPPLEDTNKTEGLVPAAVLHTCFRFVAFAS